MSSHHHRKTGVLTFPPPPGSTPTFQALSQGIVTPSSYSGVPRVHDVSVDSPPPAWRHILSPKSHMKHHDRTSHHHNKTPTLYPDHGIPIQYDSPSSYQPPPPLPATITQMWHTTSKLY